SLIGSVLMSATAYLVMTNLPPQKWLGTLLERRQVVGRGDEADIQVPAEYTHVSRRHAEFWTNEDGYWVADLDSTSGTRVNSVPLTPHQSFRITLRDHLCLSAPE